MNMPLLIFVFAFLRERAIADFRIYSLNKEVIPKEKILPGIEMDEPVAEKSVGNSYEAPRTRRLEAIEASIKKAWKSSHLKVPCRHLAA